MSNIYSMPLMIRRGENKVKNLGLQNYLDYMLTSGIFEDSNQYIDFGNGAPGYAFFHGVVYLGAKNVELRNTKSSNDYWGIPYNSVLRFVPVSDNDSFKYAIIRILVPEGGDLSTYVNLFATDFAESKGFKSVDGSYGGYPLDLCSVSATLYPFIYEHLPNEQKLTTYSVKTPNSTTEKNRRGTEPLELSFGNGNWSVYGSSWSASGYQDYANKLISHLGSYTRQLSGTRLEFGFLAILRGNLPNNWSPRNHIRWFLQRCTDIDVNNDWTHIQLT